MYLSESRNAGFLFFKSDLGPDDAMLLDPAGDILY
jgi:hypothetical protein